jgi:hypothetical protein
LSNPKLEALHFTIRNRGHVAEEELAAFTQQVMVSNKFGNNPRFVSKVISNYQPYCKYACGWSFQNSLGKK